MPKQPATMFDPAKTFDDNFDNGPFPLPSDTKPYLNSSEPQHTFLGHKLYSPFGVAAGSMPTAKHIKYAFERGFDVNVYKTQRSVPFEVNEFPNVVYLDVDGDLTPEKAKQPQLAHLDSDQPIEELTITNSFGNPSRGPEFWVDDIKKAVGYAGKGQLLMASVVGTIQPDFNQQQYYDDFAKTAGLAASTGVKVIEVNLSCPNVANEGVICYTYDAVIDICRKIKETIGDIPLVAKLGYFTDEQQELLAKIVLDTQDYLAGFSVINTIQAPIVDEKGEQILPGEGRLRAGICGHGIKWAGLDMVKRLDTMRKEKGMDYQIIGVGGVATPKDFADYRAAGADVVQSVTAAMWNSGLAAEIKASLAS
ncbi:MAG TPA: diguanylate cyclase [Candidatus Saccharimonadia bacterium]|nr:diguanylate cyclase [Candidatus Saccharimonadia bacterium]